MAKIKKEKPIIAKEDAEKTVVAPPIVVQPPIEVPPPPTIVTTNQSNQSQVIIISGAKQEPVTPLKVEGENFEARLLNYLGGRSNVTANEFLKAEFKDGVKLQIVNKQLKGKLQSLVAAKKIKVTDNAHLKLGGFFYTDNSTETQHYTVRNTKIEITAL